MCDNGCAQYGCLCPGSTYGCNVGDPCT
jgi:hypothetical protein